MSSPSYSVTLHHLAPDAKASGLAYPDEHLVAVSIGQLRELLYALVEVASRQTIYEPASPEIRIKTDRDIFVVRTRYRRLCFMGWEAILRGEDHSVAYILAAITGSVEHGSVLPKIERPEPSYRPNSTSSFDTGSVPRWVKITIVATVIVAVNALAAWLFLRPPAATTPKYTLLSEFESHALLAKTAGEYVTGNNQGDHRLLIESDGTLRVGKIGPKMTTVDESTKTAQGGLAEGRAALIISDSEVLTIKDAETVVLSGTVYHRKTP